MWFGIPHTLVIENGQQFQGNKIKDSYVTYEINQALSTPCYVDNNGQAEASNKTIFKNIKNKILNKK